MKKNGAISIVFFALMLAPVAIPASPAAESDTRFGFSEACGACHGEVPEYRLLGAKMEYEESGHSTLGNSHYANGNGCQQCHTNEGFIEYTQTGKVEGYIKAPSQPGCFTCHTPHTTGDFSLRTTAPVVLADGVTFDKGAGNLCASCHKSRANAQETVTAMPANSIRSFWGAHHGPQADVLIGTNAYEYPGQTYSSSEHSKLIKDGCAICHMAQPAGRYSLSASVGGHSFSIVGEVHEQDTANISACVSCHEDVKQVPGRDIYDVAAEGDYDLDGNVEPLQDEVIGLLAKFSNAEGTGYLQTLDLPFYNADGSWNQATVPAERPVKEVAALYNYKFMLEDRSKGIHNAIYTIQILYDAIKELDPEFDDSRRPE